MDKYKLKYKQAKRNLTELEKVEKLNASNGLPEYVVSINNEDDQLKKKLKEKGSSKPLPKKPSNAFLMYCQKERNNMKEIHQDKNLSEVTKMMGHAWQSLNDEDKQQRYYEMADRDKKRYEQELQVFNNGARTNSSNDLDQRTHQPSSSSAMESNNRETKAETPEDNGINHLEPVNSNFPTHSEHQVDGNS